MNIEKCRFFWVLNVENFEMTSLCFYWHDLFGKTMFIHYETLFSGLQNQQDLVHPTDRDMATANMINLNISWTSPHLYPFRGPLSVWSWFVTLIPREYLQLINNIIIWYIGKQHRHLVKSHVSSLHGVLQLFSEINSRNRLGFDPKPSCIIIWYELHH